MVLTNPVPEKNRDNAIKTKMLGMPDGFFLNALIGLSYLAADGWKFTDEESDAAIEELWQFHSDSVQVWAQDLNPEPELVESKAENRTSTLGGEKWEKLMAENMGARQIVDDLYSEYTKWCSRKQIEPVKPKPFSAWLGDHDFIIRQRTIEEGIYRAKRKKVTYATWNRDHDLKEVTKTDRAADDPSWEAYFSSAPLTFERLHDSQGQSIHHAREKNEWKYSVEHTYNLPSWIVQRACQHTETHITGFADENGCCTIRLENSEEAKIELPSRGEPSEEKAAESQSIGDSDMKTSNMVGMGESLTKVTCTIEDGDIIRDQLLNLGYNLDPSICGSDMGGNFYMIGVFRPSDHGKYERLLRQMEHVGFEMQNTGASGPILFTRALCKDSGKPI